MPSLCLYLVIQYINDQSAKLAQTTKTWFAPIRNIFYFNDQGLRYVQGKKTDVLNPIITSENALVLSHLFNEKYDLAICLKSFLKQSDTIIINHINASGKYSCWKTSRNISLKKAIKITRGIKNFSPKNNKIHQLGFLIF